MKLKILLFLLCFYSLLFLSDYYTKVQAQTYTASTSGTTHQVDGVYVDIGLSGSGPQHKYMKASGSSNSSTMFVFYYAGFFTMIADTTQLGVWYYYSPVANNGNLMPLTAQWTPQGGGIGNGFVTTTQNTTSSTTTFANGSSLTPPTGTPNTNNNVIGRFQLTGSSAGGALQAVTIAFSGVRSGINNLKLWSSTDNTFNSGSDIQLSSKANAASVAFNGFNSLIAITTGTYYFVTMDLAAGANGHITATIPSQASFTLAGANAPSSFTNAPLSSGAIILPVELTSFNGSISGKAVSLNWQTATETNNYGFEILRSQKSEVRSQKSGDVSHNESSWEKIGFVKGVGNSNSNKQYAFIDDKPLAGNTYYRLKQVDNDGTFTYSQEVMVASAPAEFSLAQNYPNPFNPVTKISYSLPEKTNVKLTIYDVLGKEVALLVNNEQEGGVYAVEFNGANLNSGVYFYKLETGKFTQVKKLMLVK